MSAPDGRPLAQTAVPQKELYVHGLRERLNKTGWWHSFELPDGSSIEGVNSVEGLRQRIAQFPIPQDLAGKRVLDIGAWDGWFTFEMERRGAEVVAVDNWENEKFRYVHQLLGSRAEYRILDVYELTPDRIGQFDIVLFMGVLYHLKHPLLALERVCALTREMAAVDTYVLPQAGPEPIMEFYETDEFGGQFDNWCGPNIACLLAWCRTAGFARVEFLSRLEYSGCVACYRKWELPPADLPTAAPVLTKTEHNTDFGINFDSSRDEYVSCWFTSEEAGLTRQQVMPETGGFGSMPIFVKEAGEAKWQVNFKLPPGLAPGWHEVRVRTVNSAFSNAQRIAVDIPARSERLTITGVQDGKTWELGRVQMASEVITVWVTGLPDNADRNNVRVLVNGERLAVEWVGPLNDRGERQINAALHGAFSPGPAAVVASLGDTGSQPEPLELI